VLQFLEEEQMTRSEMIYARFEAFEEQLAHCYFLLHERFIATSGLAKFWLEIAIQELQHSAMLRFCRERNVMADVEIHWKIGQNIEQLLETVKAIATDPDVSVDEAFYASLLIESSELEDVYGRLTAALQKDHQLLFEAIRANLRAHHDAFAKAASEFSHDRGFAEAFKNLGRAVSVEKRNMMNPEYEVH
jgi:hypothetical protein